MVWTEVVTTQIPNWAAVNDAQTANWTPVVT